MKHIVDIINHEINVLKDIELNFDANSSDKLIAKKFLSNWSDRSELPKLGDFANDLFVSSSTISKFIKRYSLKEYSVLRFIFKINSIYDKAPVGISKDKIDLCAKQISDANKIILIGQGSSGLIAKQFYIQLVLNNINTVFVEGIVDQQKLLSNSKPGDLVICISRDFSHNWTNGIIELKCKKIIFTAKNLQQSDDAIILRPSINYIVRFEEIDYDFVEFVNQKFSKIMKKILNNTSIK